MINVPSERTHCFNCGARAHISADCPVKNLGTRCFGCREFGHVASKCPKKDGIVSSFCVERSSGKKYMKNVMIDGVKIKALIDTGSDISLMRADE